MAQKDFATADKESREAMLMALAEAEDPAAKEFFGVMKSETITGFATVKEVMVDYRKYQVAPGFYNGCVDATSNA